MSTKAKTPSFPSRNWLDYAILVLLVEKIIQHTFVSLAFFFNWGNIAATVVVNPNTLLILGSLVTVLFCLALWGMLRRRRWATQLVLGLALFDIAGEIIAQGRLAIEITISFLVACLLLALAAFQIHQQYHNLKLEGFSEKFKP